jgi:hypothetical protein
MLAMPGAPLVHVPPVTLFDKTVVEPRHTVLGPVNVPATAVFVTDIVCTAVAVPQAPVTVYVKLTVPAETPFTDPVEAPIVATLVLLLAHVPPDTLLVSDVTWLTQMLEVPDITPAVVSGFTVTIVVFAHPVLSA